MSSSHPASPIPTPATRAAASSPAPHGSTHAASGAHAGSDAQPGVAAAVPAVPFRIGQGYDLHVLVEGRPLIIGGVHVEHPLGLAGHSDADVLAHAITDALLGAAGLGDIGHHFPDTDPAFRGADSLVLLKEAMAAVRARGWQLGNIDATIIAQQPKMKPWLPGMITALSGAIGCDPAQINLKAKTNEKVGTVGRCESIAALASALLVR
mgnify:FL=1